MNGGPNEATSTVVRASPKMRCAPASLAMVLAYHEKRSVSLVKLPIGPKRNTTWRVLHRLVDFL